jgi:uncharacterized membrane protein (UPF0182 family)
MLVNNSTNLAAYISANSDPDNYGQITVLTVNNSAAIQGPEQVANDFKTFPAISKDISLLNQGQSQIIHGNLLTLPVGKSFLYVEPLYVQSTFPTLERVLVSYGGKLGYAATLSQALSDLLPGHQTGQTLDTIGGGASTSPGSSTSTPTSTPSGSSSSSPPVTTVPTQQQQLAALDQAYADLQTAVKSGDFARIGAAQAKVNNLLQAYLAKYGPTQTPTPTPTKSK